MGLIRVVLTVSERMKPALVRIFPYRWLSTVKRSVVELGMKQLKYLRIAPFQRELYPDGINLIGSFKAETGLGQSCRLVARELDASDVPHLFYLCDTVGDLSNRDTEFDGRLEDTLRYNINLIHINPYDLANVLLRKDRSLWDGRYNIGFWLWELEEFPNEWLPCLACLDEIWTPSEFVSSAIRKKTDKPVITVPYHVEAKTCRPYSRRELGLPEDKFLFLTMYDRNSMTERKNPEGVLKAYREAFAGQEDVGLVIKVNNCSEEELQDLKKNLKDQRNLYFITEPLNRDQVNSLLKEADVLVSLHRAEGFGLVMAEAMFLGTPVIATNWSSNTEFMDSSVACMVDYQLVELDKRSGVFQKGNRWAEPDTGQAAAYMRRLYEDEGFRKRLSADASRHIREHLSMERAVSILEYRVREIYKETAV